MSLLAVAPGFHLASTWAGRLRLGAGFDPAEGGLSPRPPWREPDEAALASLVGEPSGGHVCLFALPAHLLASFWATLERTGGLPAEEARGFFAEVARFLDYKRLAAPSGAVFEVTACLQGQAVIGPVTVWAVANLGDEPTHVVFAAGGVPVRLRLEPGEGYRLPAGGMTLGSCTLDKKEPDVLLVIRLPEGG